MPNASAEAEKLYIVTCIIKTLHEHLPGLRQGSPWQRRPRHHRLGCCDRRGIFAPLDPHSAPDLCFSSAFSVMWGRENPTATILLMFIIPISGKWMAWLSAALVFFQTQPPQLAPFAALPLLLAYLFAANKLPVSYSRHDRRYTAPAKKTERYDRKYYEEVRRREQDRNERERLRKLFESSVNE